MQKIIPDEILAGGHIYKVIIPYKWKERFDINAQVDHDTLEIRIASHDSGGIERKKSRIQENFLHEILHIADYLSGHNIFKNNENAIEGINNSLFQILMDNKLLNMEGE